MLIKIKNAYGTIFCVEISRQDKVSVVKEAAQKLFKLAFEKQRLFYGGKLLDDNYTLFDYGVNSEAVIQVMEKLEPLPRNESPVIQDHGREMSPDEKAEEITQSENEVTSLYFQVGDYVYCRDAESGVWNDGKIVEIRPKEHEIADILSKDPEHDEFAEMIAAGQGKTTLGKNGYQGKKAEKKQKHISETAELEDLLYKVELDIPAGDGNRYLVVSMIDIRLPATARLLVGDIVQGMRVIVNYNLDSPSEPGNWYEAKITNISESRSGRAPTVMGNIFMGNSETACLSNCRITFCNSLRPMEPYVKLSLRDEDAQVNAINLEEPCGRCKDDPNKMCKECNCVVCGSKENEAEQILCDQCNVAYHIGCLDPPLFAVPTEDHWYCPECKVDPNEIVAPGAQLKYSKKKANSASAKAAAEGKKIRDWGRGNSTAGLSTKCTIVPLNHFGPIPGVEVGTCWQNRILAAEAGVHRAQVAGIAGRSKEGAFSIIVSGGYEDNVDFGVEFIYTGSGGRNLEGNKRVAAQDHDQQLTDKNLSLALNCDAPIHPYGNIAKDWKNGKPVRVLRKRFKPNSKTKTKYEPEAGVRYDGLYKVVRYYQEKGKSGYFVWRFVMRRDDPSPAPWTKEGKRFIRENGLEEMICQKKPDLTQNGGEAGTSGQKRKAEKSEDQEVPDAKKIKIKEYVPEEQVAECMRKDKNVKLWEECNLSRVLGKKVFLQKVQESFTCVVCQELVHNPVTTDCLHNICQTCLQRAFKAGVKTCPCCRFVLDQNAHLNVNSVLSQALNALFPGYGTGR